MQIGSVCNRITDVDGDSEADSAIRWLIAVVYRDLLLHLHGTAHRPVDAVECDQQRIAPGLNDPATVLLDGGIDYLSSQRTQSLEGSGVIPSDQAAVANHVGVHNGDQLAPICQLPSKVRCVAPRHTDSPTIR